jgi:8-oxo-dGTP pyrophosphatase MutT (NUDIX family)
MAMSPWLAGIRNKVGDDLLLLASSAGLVFDADDRLLVVRDIDTGNYVTPGGYLDPDENPAECCVRELREEVGLDVEIVAMLGTFSGPEFVIRYRNGHLVQAVISIFECRVRPGSPGTDADAVATDDTEVTDHRWVHRAELDSLPLQPWATAVLTRVLDARGGLPLTQ